MTISPSQNRGPSSRFVLALSSQRYQEIRTRAFSYTRIRSNLFTTTSARKNSFLACAESTSGVGFAGSIPILGLKPQFAKNGEIPVVSLIQLFVANLVRGSQSTQSSQVKLTKPRRYLFITALTISVWPSVSRCQVELGFSIIFTRSLRRRQKSETNPEPRLEIMVSRAPYNL